jgi:hypothetical protein
LNATLRLAAVLFCLALCGCRTVPFDVAPTCAQPAPLLGKYDRRAPGYFIAINGTVPEFWSTLARWDHEYSMHVDSKYSKTNVIQVTPTPAEVARLRRDPAVKFIEHNGVVLIGAIVDVAWPLTIGSSDRGVSSPVSPGGSR